MLFRFICPNIYWRYCNIFKYYVRLVQICGLLVSCKGNQVGVLPSEADNTQLFTAFRGEIVSCKLSQCTIALQQWFWSSCLLLNLGKSDVAFYETRLGLQRIVLPSPISIGGCAIGVSERLDILGVTFDATMSFDDHITNVVRACNFHLRPIRHIRLRVTQDIARTLSLTAGFSTTAHCCPMQLVGY